MKRGDVVFVAAAGDYGKPRPAVILQSDAFPSEHEAVIICRMTSELVDAPDFRITVEPNKDTAVEPSPSDDRGKPAAGRR
jgi:mRNA interferase MazF